MAISIHAPREGGDIKRYTMSKRGLEFQSTPPARGATLNAATDTAEHSVFQSTPPARGATMRENDAIGNRKISIHAPREGGDALIFILEHP